MVTKISGLHAGPCSTGLDSHGAFGLGAVWLILSGNCPLDWRLVSPMGSSGCPGLWGDYQEARVHCYQYTAGFRCILRAWGTLGLAGCWKDIISMYIKAILSSVRECLNSAGQGKEKICSSCMSLQLRDQAWRLQPRYKILVCYLSYLTLECHIPTV